MKPEFPAGPATRSALYLLGLLAALKALALVLMGQAVASLLVGLVAGNPLQEAGLLWGVAGALLRSGAVWGQGVASRRAALGVKEELRARILERSLSSGNAAASGRADGTGDPHQAGRLSDGGLAVLATRGLDSLDNYYTQFLPALVNCAAIPLLVGVRILFADWVSAAVVVLTVPLVPLFMVLIGRYTEDRVREAQSALARLSGHILELAKGLPVLVGLGRASAQRRALEDISEEYRLRTMGTLRTAFMSALALELIATISVAVVAVFIGVRLVAGEMPLEAGLLALILAPECYLPLRELGTAHHASDDGRVALAAANEVVESPAGNPLAPDTASGSLTVTNLTVRYQGRSRNAVGPLTFQARTGAVTALDGPSGTGKSTVLAVLAGNLADDCGADDGGTVVRGTVSGFHREDIAWVPQHPVILEQTVRAEIRLYLGRAGSAVDSADTEALVSKCLQDAAAAHLADRHPAELSPGELRRVALARGLARVASGASILLLDEPTAHLDREAAEAVHRAISGLRGRATILLVAHDRQTRELADVVVDLSSGRSHPPTASPGSVSPGSAIMPIALGTAESGRPASGTVASAEAQAVPSARRSFRGLPGLLGRLLAPTAGRFAAAGLVGTLAAAFAVALAGLSGWLIIRASEQPPILYLLGAIVGVRFFGIGRAVLRYCERLLLHDAVFAALTKLRGSLWEALSRRALSLRRLLQGGNVLGSVIDDVDTVRDLLPRVVLPPVTAVLLAAAATGTVAMVLPAAVPATAAAAVLSLVAAPAAALLADKMSARSEQRLRSVVLSQVAAALDARDDLRANSVTDPVLAAIRDADRAATAASQRSAWAEGLGQAIVVLACSAAALLSGWLAAPVVLDGTTAPAAAAVVVLLQLALVESYAAVVSAVRLLPSLRDVLRRIGDSGVWDSRDDVTAPSGLHNVPSRHNEEPGVALESLAAEWPGGRKVFGKVSATAAPGRWLVVTGPSGSGKSTLMAVLLGFLPPAAGSVRATGKVAWCPQEAHLFDSTIRGNLMLGLGGFRRSDQDDAPVWMEETRMQDALKAVGLAALVEGFEEGIDTRIGPGGAFLSGGERQRLAVARTLMTGAEVILLDEPTAHLDAESGSRMLAELRAGLADRTVILVTHNPADINDADVRLVLGGNATSHAPLETPPLETAPLAPAAR
ncbi:thiol reductant ABC exporter subunit CydD [Arthrobacter sp. ISL-30]|uniref:thiol reductant ABC exporter subunit CydD n=1 Tax=Arthrobacter sp. ISL-30 TaxID=2819109 RepID=UPI001BE53523|nr:thiol reductant ABC exporter subunit CydD [Arthrobacter sp. ISL-30]MBT2512123.1 thiol reductant ABC exporter subunit CydD [Arthrobacter sp. ISL-30]